jgi:L-ascorbate metabolism protein UlaG (beta-lactamase superfamily)
MKLTYYGYNAFVIEAQGLTALLDPGQHLHWRRLDPLIPRDLWARADLILVTHGDPDHAEFVSEAARASGAPVVCGPGLAHRWRRDNLQIVPVAPGEVVEVAGVPIRGYPMRHGPEGRLFGRTFSLKPWFVGVGAVGFLFTLEGRRLFNLGDTLPLDVWDGLRPDVLMIPIGGLMTMDVDQALAAVAAIEPGLVLPTHHNWDFLFYHRPADVGRFAEAVQAAGRRCIALAPGERLEV